MLDIHLFRNEGPDGLDLVRESQRRRCEENGQEKVDEVIRLDLVWRQCRQNLDDSNAQINALGKQIKETMKNSKDKKKAKEECAVLITEQQELKKRIEELKKEEQDYMKARDAALFLVGNIIGDDVPVSETEDDNLTVRTFGGQPALIENGMSHHELLWRIGGFEPDRGSSIAGHRAYFLRGPAVKLHFALIHYALDFLINKDYTPLQPPYFMNKDIMEETAELAQFDEELYKVIGDDEKYLIATSEQPISAFHRGDWIMKDELPLKYAGYSACFRKEAGKHGKDTWGIFRVHQFEKVEQFLLTLPEDSCKYHEEMLGTAEAFFQSLQIPYRVINIVSGALNKAAAKKYDVEAWFPGYAEYKEVVSCSNCTDYQARRLGVRLRAGDKDQGKQYVHMLNGTLCATTRTICAILENHQTETGIRIPDALLPYMHLPPQEDGTPTTEIPFIREVRKDNTGALITK